MVFLFLIEFVEINHLKPAAFYSKKIKKSKQGTAEGSHRCHRNDTSGDTEGSRNALLLDRCVRPVP